MMGTRSPTAPPLMPNQRWSLDFVSDQLADGHQFRTMCPQLLACIGDYALVEPFCCGLDVALI